MATTTKLPPAATRFKPGRSGNPAGRPPGLVKVGHIREALAKKLPGILDRLVAAAEAGDVAAARLIVERVLPVVKPVELPAAITLPPGDDLAGAGHAILQAAAAGTLAPGQAAALLGAVGTLARVVEVADLAQRVERLERGAQGDGDEPAHAD